MSDQLPEGWAEATLGDVITGFEAGRNLRAKGGPAGPGECGVLKISAVTWGSFRPEENKALLPGDEPKPHERIKKGDLLITRANTSDLVGAVVLVDRDHPELMLPDKILRLRPKEATIDRRYLLQALRTQTVREHFERNATGTSESMRNLSQPKMAAAPITIAPLPEQRRIVAQVDALLEQVSRARERLDRVPLILKRFRQAVLAAACSGRLTEDWREQHGAESGHVLLKSLREAVPPNKKASPGGDYADDLDVPASWGTARLGDVVTLVTSGSRGWAEYYADAGPIFIRAQDINTDTLDLGTVAHVKPPSGSEGSRTRVQQGDLLVTITGANVAKSAWVETAVGEAYVSQHVGLARPVRATVTPWLHRWLVSPAHGRKQLLDAAYGAGKPGLNLDNVRDLAIALPPLSEQAEALGRVERLFRLADTIEHRVQTATSRADKLPQAILSKAFSGELVPTEADLALAEGRTYETAAELLARVSAEAPKPSATNRRRRTA